MDAPPRGSQPVPANDRGAPGPLRILVLTHFYHPETGGTPNRIVPIVEAARDAGHVVHVVTNKPNHPEGRIRDAYRGRILLRRVVFGVPVTYCWVYASPRKSFLHRVLNYLSFMVMGIIAGVAVRGRFDIVFASSPPLPVGIAGWVVARLKRARYVFDVRDQWPEVAVALGELSRPGFVRLAERMEAFIYRHADAITSVTRGFVADIRAAVGDSRPVELVRNGTVPETFSRDDRRPAGRDLMGAGDRFVVLFAGNIGVAQGLDHVMEAAAQLQERKASVLFVFLGSGARLDFLRREAERRTLQNVRFLPRTDLETAAGLHAAADALLVALVRHEVFQKYIPSKLYDAMAAGRPLLLSVDGEARDLVEEHGAGVYYPPEDAAGLVGAVEWLRAHPQEASAMGRRGRDAAVRCYSRSEQAGQLLQLFDSLVGSPRTTPPRSAQTAPSHSNRI